MSNWNPRANELLIKALDYLDPADRNAFLDRACAGEKTLRQEVATLLRAHDQAGDFLNTPHPAVASTTHNPDAGTRPDQPVETARRMFTPAPGVVIDARYKLIQPIGEGGMGSVWLGEQIEPVQRVVAVKLIRAAGVMSKRIVARFEVERQAIALMDHPHIARMFDAGTADDGSPYFVMEFVDGVPLTEYCETHRLSIPERLALFVRVCSAVHHAHQKGVIHRDLKPSNILVEELDGLPVPKIIDFGLAKAASGPSLTDHPQLTAFGTVAGTPLYMSPEQAAFDAVDIDTRADIYTLGVVLFELLTGTTPISRESLQSVPAEEALRVIRVVEPPRPSSRISSAKVDSPIATNRQSELVKLGRFVRGDLDWIAMKALAKDRDRRYESASELVADIERFLNHEPVLAGPPSTGYRLRKFVRRNRPQVVAVAFVLLVLVAGMVGTTLGMIEARRQATIAREERDAKEEARTSEVAQRRLAEQAEEETLAALRASTNDAIEQLIGSKQERGPRERVYLERTLARWQTFASRTGEDERSRAVRAEGHFQVGALWQRLDRYPEARLELETARGSLKQLTDEFPESSDHRSRLAETQRTLGLVFIAQGKAAEAQTEFEAARHLLTTLITQSDAVEHSRSLARIRTGLGTTFRSLNELDRANEEFEKARDLWRKLADAYPGSARQELATIHNFLGILHADRGRHDEAIKEYKQSRDYFQTLVNENPDEPESAVRLAQAHYNMGLAFQHLDRFDEALGEYKLAVTIQRQVADQFPSIPRYRRALAVSHNAIGIYSKAMKRWDEARSAYKAVIDVQQQLTDAFPTAYAYKQGLARAHNNLGNVAYSVGDWKEADTRYRFALELHEQLVAAFGLAELRLDLASTYQNIGNLTRDTNKLDKSLAWYGLAIGLLKPLQESDSGNADIRSRLRVAHFHRGEAYKRLSRFDQAILDFDQSVEHSPPELRKRLRAYRAEVLVRTGRLADAVAEADELTSAGEPDASGVGPWELELWYNFACIYSIASASLPDKKEEYAQRAVRLLKKAATLGFEDVAHLLKDADLVPLRDRADFRELLTSLRRNHTSKEAPLPPPRQR